MKAVAIVLILVATCLAAYVALGGGDMLREAGRSTLDDIKEAGRGVLPATDDSASNSPAPDTETQNETTGTSPAKGIEIELPAAISNVEWGMSESEIRDSFRIGFEKVETGGRTLVHEPKGKAVSYRFILTDRGLDAVEVRYSAPDRAETKQLYDKIQAELVGRYGDLPDARLTQWADGVTRVKLSLDYGLLFVELRYNSQRR